jgi:penicillin-binding protein activator
MFGLMAVCMLAMTGCRMFWSDVKDVDLNKPEHMKSTYDFQDMRKFTETVCDDIVKSYLSKMEKPPIMMVAGIQNRTKQHVDTKAITEAITMVLIRSGKAEFVNAARRDEILKEQGFQAANVTPEMQVAIGKQAGAKYMITGSLVEMESTSPREVSLSRKQVNYYALTVEITDLETSKMWTSRQEFARKASQPLIGW